MKLCETNFAKNSKLWFYVNEFSKKLGVIFPIALVCRCHEKTFYVSKAKLCRE